MLFTKPRQKLSFTEVMELTPEQIASSSVYTKNAYEYVQKKLAALKPGFTKVKLTEMFSETKPSFLQLYQNKKAQKEIWQKLVEQNFLSAKISVAQLFPQSDFVPPVWVASGSGYRGHHAHPGGLVIHIEENIRLSLYLTQLYQEMYGLSFDEDMVIFAQVAHDLAKPWLANWLPDGSCLPQFALADTGAHHIFALAESIYRNIPPEYVFCQAAAHIQSTSKIARNFLEDFLQAAFLLAGKNPEKYGMFDRKGKLLFEYRQPEFWFTYLGDQMLFTVTQSRMVVKALEELAEKQYKFSATALTGKPFNQLRNYVFSTLSVASAFHILRQGSLPALQEAIAELIEFC